ncbi:hypothetical protein Tco_0924032 [Tanacetum coccineum]|uniref:Uncharacterized protein n=1 Tax=Tanacetum coccineum TaxID=301880 RepID=A0ABQ5D5T9_9ASTR
MTESPIMDSGFVVPVFSLGDDPIACLNNVMAFLTAVASSRFSSTNNQLRTSLNLRNQATIQDDKVTVQQVQGRLGQSYSGIGYKSNATSFGGNNASGQAKVVRCYNCRAKAQEARQILDEEQLGFLADPGVPDGQAVQTIIPNNAVFQTEDLDTYDSNCDDISNAKAVLMANISNYGSDAISEANVQDTNLQAQQDSMILSVIEHMSEHMINHVNNWEKANKEQNNESVTAEIEGYKEHRIKPTLYDGIVISSKHVVMPVIDDEETLILEEESRSKMFEKEKDPEAIKQNISYKPIDYEKLNRLSDDFEKHFTPQQELSTDQAFWLRMSNPTSKSSYASPVIIEAPKELPKVSLVNESLKKLKFHLARFDNVVKIRTTPDARSKGEWRFEHTKAVFNKEIIPFLKSLKDIFNSSVDKQCLEIAKKELLLENDRLLQQIMSQDVLLTMMNYVSLIGEFMNMDRKRNESYDKCFNLEAELLKSQHAHNDLLKNGSCDNQNALEIPEFCKNNDLKSQLQDKDTTICKLKEIIKSMREKSKEENVNYDYYEIL